MNGSAASDYDNFYSPHNSDFYKMSPYLALNPNRREVRMLKIAPSENQPSKNDGTNQPQRMIRCQIEDKVPLARVEGSYYALSYCAGDPKKITRMSVNGRFFNAFANLEHAIQILVDYWIVEHPDDELLIWADQISINQSDKQERASQVKFMKEIYRCAAATFVCLSNPGVLDCLSWAPRIPWSANTSASSRSTSALVRRGDPPSVLILKKTLQYLLLGKEHYLQFRDGSEDVKAEPNQAKDTTQSAEPGSVVKLGEHLPRGAETVPRKPLPPRPRKTKTTRSSEQDQPEIPDIPEDRNIDPIMFQDSLRAFVTSGWWYRAWVFQEFIASHKVIFVSGSTLIDWAELSPLVEFISFHLVPFVDSISRYIGTTITVHKERGRSWDEKYLPGRAALSIHREKCEEIEKEQVRCWNLAYNEQSQKLAVVNQKIGKSYGQANTALKYQEEKLYRTSAINFIGKSFRKKWVRELALRAAGGHNLAMQASNGKVLKEYYNDSFKSTPERILYWKSQFRYGWGIDVDSPHWQDELTKRWSLEWARDCVEQYEQLSQVPNNWEDYKPSSYPLPPRPTVELAEEDENPFLKAGGTASQWEAKKGAVDVLLGTLQRLDLTTIVSMVKNKSTFKRSANLTTVLQHSRHCEASDPRDRIYGFLGLAHRGYNIAPDYSISNTIVNLLIETAKEIILRERSLSILSHVHRGRDQLRSKLPTWVPDWTSRESEKSVPQKVLELMVASKSGAECREFDAAKGLSHDLKEFRKDPNDVFNLDIMTKGVMVDILDELDSEDIEEQSSFQVFVSENNRLVLAPESARIDDEVWVLHGASIPVLLRPYGEDSEGLPMFSFLGEVVLLNAEDEEFSNEMYGSALESGEAGAKTTELWMV